MPYVCYLRHQSDTLDGAKQYPSKAAAIRAYERTARELIRYGQTHEATLHIVATRDDHPDEYPDYVLSLGPREGLHIESC